MEEEYNIKTKFSKRYFEKDSSQLRYKNIEQIQIHFNLINGQINNTYRIELKKKDNINFNDSITSDIITCNDNGPMILFKYSCDYCFGKEQKFKIEFFFGNSYSFPISTSIGEIVGNKKSTKLFDIPNRDEKIRNKSRKNKK